MVLDKYGIYSYKLPPVPDLNELAIFSLVRKSPSAQTCMTVYRESDGQTLDIDFMAGMPENREYNLIQGSDGKQGLTGITGIGSNITLDEGIFTVTSAGTANYVNMQWRPLIFNSAGRRIFFRSRSRLISGNIPRHIFLHFDTETTGRTTYELPIDLESVGEWVDFSGIVNMGTSHYLDGDVDGALPDNRIINRVLIEVEYASQADAINTIWQLDGRVSDTENSAAIAIDMGASSINPLYNMTVEEMNTAFPKYVKAFGFANGEVDASSIILFCKDTTGYVKNWKDQSGNDYTAIQNTSANMPIICSNNTAYDKIVFYGTNDYFRTNGAVLNGQSEYTITTKHTSGLGGNFSTDNVYRFIFSQGNISNLVVNASSNLLEFGVNNTYYASTTAHLFDDISTTIQKTDDEIKIYTNGKLIETNSTVPITITDTSNTYIGTDSTRFFYGALFELCFYGSKPSDRIASALSQPANVNDSSAVNQVETALDKVSGAIVAYGLVKLNPDATKCLRVRRQSDKTEMDIGFVGKYFDSNTAENLAGYSSLEIIKVYDQSGNEFNLRNNDTETENIPQTSIITSSDVNVTSDTVNDIFVTGENVDGYGILSADDGTITFKGVIPSNGVYSYEFWAKCEDERTITVDVNGANSKIFNVSNTKWKHCKLETFTVSNYSTTNNYLQISIPAMKFLQIYGLKVCNNRRISNKPLIIDNGTLKTGIMMDIGKYMWTSNTNCRARYIRDYLKRGSNISSTSHWVQVSAIKGIENIASGKTVTCNFTIANGSLSYVTDDNIVDYLTTFVGAIAGSVDPYVQVDLGDVYDLDNVVTWHMRTPAPRTYYGNVTQVSEDGINWTTIYDSDIDGERVESESGNVIFDRNLHNLNDFSIYTGFTTDFANSQNFARIVAKGGAGIGTTKPVQAGWSVSRFDTSTTGDFRVDTNYTQNMLARLSNVWDTGHSLFYEWDNTDNKLLVYKDWKVMTSVTGIYGATAIGGGYVSYPNVGAHTINNPLPVILGGFKASTVGSIKTLIVYDHILTEEEIISLKNCAL